MKLNQLFKAVPPWELLVELCQCFGLDSPDDARMFDKFMLKRLGTATRIKDVYLKLKPYYLPCKAAMYINDRQESTYTMLTVLRHLLRLYDYHIVVQEKSIAYQKVMKYHIEKRTSGAVHVSHSNCVLNFD